MIAYPRNNGFNQLYGSERVGQLPLWPAVDYGGGGRGGKFSRRVK